MDRTRSAVLLVVIGWLLVVVFGLLLLGKEPASAAIYIVVGLVMAAWVRWRPGVAALVVSLVLGLLQTVEQGAYLATDAGEDTLPVGTALADAEGLLGGLLVVAGSVTVLVRRRQARAGIGQQELGRSAVG
jgi:hypothetical protein